MENNAVLDKRNSCIDILRFIFCLLIINYHLFSHFFRNIDFPNYFIRGYMGDEFFFIVTGYYLSESVMKTKTNPIKWNISQLIKRVKKIAIPYYFTWILCFIGRNYTSYRFGESRNVFLDLMNSIYELLFLEMFGFKKGLYSNDVGWFFSALLIITVILGPIIVRFKKAFTTYIAPMVAFFSYGILSLSFDYLHDPYLLIPNTYIMKGIIRALAAICMGAFLNGIVHSDFFVEFANKVTKRQRAWISFFDVFLWIGIVYYMIFPFKSNAEILSIQYDYIMVVLMAFALLPILGNILTTNNRKISRCSKKLGEYAFFAYFGQAVFYSVDRIIYGMNASILQKAVILNVSVPIITFVIWFISTGIQKYKHMKKHIPA